MTRTKIDGKWVKDAQKDYSNGKPRPTQPVQNNNLLARQKDSMAQTLASVAQCANIAQVRKCLEHGRQTYPTK